MRADRFVRITLPPGDTGIAFEGTLVKDVARGSAAEGKVAAGWTLFGSATREKSCSKSFPGPRKLAIMTERGVEKSCRNSLQNHEK